MNFLLLIFKKSKKLLLNSNILIIHFLFIFFKFDIRILKNLFYINKINKNKNKNKNLE